MPKVLHLSISSAYGGGPEHIYQLIKGLPPEYECHVACPDVGPYYKKFQAVTEGRVTVIPFRNFQFKSLLSVYKYIRINKIDILHGHGKGAGFYCRLLSMAMRIAVIHTPHGINQKIERGFVNWGYIKFERLFKQLISAIIYVSPTELKYGNKLDIWPGIPSRVILNGTKIISTEIISEMRIKTRSDMGWDLKKVIVTASRFDYQKNTIDFCKIAARLPSYFFAVLGDGVDMELCKDFCKKNCVLNISFIGAVPNPLDYIAAADLYLSTARWEGLSLAILEAMSLGLPIIATKVIGNVDLVKVEETGFLYDLNNLDSAAGYIHAAFDDVLYQRMSANVKSYHAESFSAEAMCKNTARLYNDVLIKNRIAS